MANNLERFVISLDLGGTKILAALVDQDGCIFDRIECKTLPEQGQELVVDRVLSSIQTVLDRSGVDRNKVLGIGIATAGVIDTRENKIIFAKNLRWENVPIGQLIFDRFHLPVRIGNDANIAALGEWLWGAGNGTQNLIYITVSTGVGAGIVSGGHLIEGISDSAGEFGHMSIDHNGPQCVCGNRGCLELYASGPAIAKLAQKRIKDTRTTAIFEEFAEQSSSISAKEEGEAARNGDPLAIEVFKQVGFSLGVGVTNLIHIFNPEVIVFGGGVMNVSELLLPEIEKTVRERCIPMLYKKVRFAKSNLGNEAGIIGAAGLFFTRR